MYHKQWDVHENSFPWKELTAKKFALNYFLPLIKSSYIKWLAKQLNKKEEGNHVLDTKKSLNEITSLLKVVLLQTASAEGSKKKELVKLMKRTEIRKLLLLGV